MCITKQDVLFRVNNGFVRVDIVHVGDSCFFLFLRLQFPVASSHIYHHEYPVVKLGIGGTMSLNYNVVLHRDTILMSTIFLLNNV